VPLNPLVVNAKSSSLTGLPTVPPYARFFDHGVEFDIDTINTSNSGNTSWNLAQNMFSLFLGSTNPSNALLPLPTWGHSNYVTGNGTNFGQSNAILYAVPWRTPSNNAAKTNVLPMLSLGQFQHADVTGDDIYSSVSYQPGNAFGNSLYSPFVKLNSSTQSYTNAQAANLTNLTATQLQYGGTGNITLGPGAGNGTVNAYDISYIANAGLWDHYYFSGVAQGVAPNALVQTLAVTGNATPSTSNNGLANGRMKFAAGYSPTYSALNIGTGSATYGVSDLGTATSSNPNNMPQGYALSRYLLNDGQFNVNSTSVEAWKALLASLRGTSPNAIVAMNMTSLPAANYTGIAPVEGFSRVPMSLAMAFNTSTILPNYTYNGTGAKAPYTGDSAQSFVGYRALTDADIDHLAALIVQQVRARGPFLSLAQFVNRRLDNSPASYKGALQTAIDSIPNAAAGNASATFNTLTDLTANETVTLLPTNFYANTLANATLRSTGIPGWLSQADLLQALAPVLTARSDTFVIRAYGQVNNPLDGSAQSRAWCEAIVQRYPEYVDSVTVDTANTVNASAPDNPAVAPWAATLQNNLFGRRFHLVSLRWLSAADI
jgi:hypothetical protein